VVVELVEDEDEDEVEVVGEVDLHVVEVDLDAADEVEVVEELDEHQWMLINNKQPHLSLILI
jgi:hypothetical protein